MCVLAQVANGSWSQYIVGPQNRTVVPSSVLSIAGNVTNPEGLLPNGTGNTVLYRAEGDTDTNASAITIDFGINTVGFLSIEFAGATDNTPGIRLAFSETKQYLANTSDFTRSDNGDTITPGTDQIAVQASPYTWTDTNGCQSGTQVCADGLHGFRYLKIYLDALESDSPLAQSYGEVQISSISLNYTGYLGTPDTYAGWLECSDFQLTHFWYDGAYTNEMTTDTVRASDVDPRDAASPSLEGKTVLFDGAKRDRDPYVGDLAVSGRTEYLTHYTGTPALNILADLAAHQRADGWIPPASINNYTLPLFDYPLWWVVSTWDYVLYTGDVPTGSSLYPALLSVLDAFYPSVTNTTTLLLSKGLSNTGSYGDYAFLSRSAEVTYYNALYVHALQSASSLASALNHSDDASRWSARASNVSDAVNANLWDPSVGAYFDSTDTPEGMARHPMDGNALAVLGGVANQSRAESALGYLANATARDWGNAFMDDTSLVPDGDQRVYAFLSYFDIGARFRAGLVESAFDEVRRLWGWMSARDPGTFWEGIGEGGSLYEQGYTSMAHGWSTGVVGLLTEEVLGVKPLEPGYERFEVRPVLGDLQWARGRVMGRFGGIEVSWGVDGGAFALNLTIPTGSVGEVMVPADGDGKTVSVDGKVINGTVDGGYAMAGELEGGQHLITVN
ncbi:MAG: hypothetical protein MMC23_006737 [Stictis urceolatum]|nr:hypothetical protein [Stictis urceolata]